jgi:hypothetical protein
MSCEPKFVSFEQTDYAGQEDPGRSFVIRRRNGDQYTVWVSECDFDRVMAAGKWCVHITERSRTVYVQRAEFVDGKQKHLFLHQFLTGSGPHEIDHINGSGLDNRRSNLRRATSSQNNHNTGKRPRNVVGAKGVTLHSDTRRHRRWQANISIAGKQTFLGCFLTKEEALAAYREAAIKHFGSFARFE